jgi:hypothetical protein
VLDKKPRCVSFPPWWNDVVLDALVLVQEGRLTHTMSLPWWNDVQYVFVLVQEGKLEHTSFSLQWNDVVHDVLVIV